MKVAVCFEDGKVFQHFGHTENFKIYDIKNDEILSSEVIGTEGAGHEALADFLKSKNIDVIICGGIGPGAEEALSNSGIVIFSGVEGDADEAVKSLLEGTLESVGVNCNHHESEGGCAGSCGSCSGCHGAPTILFEGKNAGKTLRVNYRGTFNDGTEFDSSYNRGEPLEFVCAIGMMIPGFDKAVVDMEVGEEKDIHLSPEEAYGMPDPNAIFTVPIAELAGSENLEVGQQVYLTNPMGQPFVVKVTAKDETNITLDANSEMAGKELNFHIEVVEIL